MTEQEIITALESCSKGVNNCTVCPYYLKIRDRDFWREELSKNALALITRQQAEIEKLRKQHIEDEKILNERVQESINVVVEANQRYVDALENTLNDKDTEVAELREIVFMDRSEAIKNLKVEAVRSFIQFLKEHACNYDIDNYHSFSAIDVEELDDLLEDWRRIMYEEASM